MSRSDRTPGLGLRARHIIRAHGFTVGEYVAFVGDAASWRGDSCGCPDDRCRGQHHGEDDACGCLEALLAELTRSGGLR